MPCSVTTSVCSVSWRPANSARRLPWCCLAAHGGAKKKDGLTLTAEATDLLDDSGHACLLPRPSASNSCRQNSASDHQLSRDRVAAQSDASAGPLRAARHERDRERLGNTDAARGGVSAPSSRTQRPRALASRLASPGRAEPRNRRAAATVRRERCGTGSTSLAADRLQVHPLGRPHLHATAEQSREVIRFLHGHGPWVGMPTLTGAVWRTCPPPSCATCCGSSATSGSVSIRANAACCTGTRSARSGPWTSPRSTIRSTAFTLTCSRCATWPAVCSWPGGRCLDLTAATAQAELELLFTIHGAPLVLKSDNGSAFRAEVDQDLFGPLAGVAALFTAGSTRLQWGH